MSNPYPFSPRRRSTPCQLSLSLFSSAGPPPRLQPPSSFPLPTCPSLQKMVLLWWQGASVQDQQDMVVRVLTTIAGPAVPPVYKLFMAPWPWAPFLTAFFTPPFFKVFPRPWPSTFFSCVRAIVLGSSSLLLDLFVVCLQHFAWDLCWGFGRINIWRSRAVCLMISLSASFAEGLCPQPISALS